MPAKSSIYIGRVFTRLTVQFEVGRNKWGTRLWQCLCACGNVTTVSSSSLKGKDSTKSCGCLPKGRHPAHGMTNTPEFRAWIALNNRCYNTENPAYEDYGARGITVADEWRHDFMAFYSHVGPRPSSKHSIDRIKNHRGYEPGNVRWATSKTQNQNKRNNLKFTLNGVTRCLAEWSRITGIGDTTLQQRRARKWSDERALTTPARGYKK